MRSSLPPLARRLGLITAGLMAGVVGVLLLTDRPGLRLDYHALPIEVSPGPVFTEVAMPRLDAKTEVADVLVSQEIFDLRWSGWLIVEEGAVFEFQLQADERAFLEIAGTRILETARETRKTRSPPLELGEGLHPVRLGLSQTGGAARIAVRWGDPGDELRFLEAESLVARDPAGLRLMLRRGLAAIGGRGRAGSVGLVLLGVGLLMCVGGLWPSGRRAGPPAPGVARPRITGRPTVRAAAWALLLALTFVVMLPYTASTTDGDDIRYMDGARFNKQMGWNMNRYAHIYALKAFIALQGGDAFEASRTYWAFLFATTVVALAVAASSLGGGLQLGTIGLALFLLFSQPDLFGGIGAAYADYSAMMFVALGLAVFLRGSMGPSERKTCRHALLLGALSVAAAKSKEPGLILLWLVPGLLWAGGRIDLRRFVRRLAWWTAGAAAAYLLLMTLDGLVLGDFWFSLRGESLAGARRLKEAAEGIWQLPRWAWLDVAWETRPRRILSVLVMAAAALSLVRPVRAELRWVAWMPVAFMAMMIAIHPAISSPRYLFPIVPVACFVVPMVLRSLLPEGPRAGAGRMLWSAALAVILIAMNSDGFAETRFGLERHRTAQRGDWTLYPWRIFRAEIEAARPKEIAVSDRLYRSYHMIGKSKTRDRVARLFFQRRHLRLRMLREPSGSIGWTLVTRADYRRWLVERPELAQRSRFDPSGRIVLVRPQ